MNTELFLCVSGSHLFFALLSLMAAEKGRSKTLFGLVFIIIIIVINVNV